MLCAGLFGLAVLAGSADRAQAVPSFARQTGLACEACHTVFPQLTPFGRVFKASGYTLSNTSKVQDVDRMKHYLMTLSDVPPISVMGVASTSSANKASDTIPARPRRISPSSSASSMRARLPTMSAASFR